MIGNGVCNDEINTAECSYDSMDCCATCQKILVTLEDNALVAKGHVEGIYHKSSTVNGYPSWTSTSKANIKWAGLFWEIKAKDFIGVFLGGIYSSNRNQCPFNLQSEQWNYATNDIGWISGKANEISINCIDGNFFLQKSNCRCSR